MVGAWPTSHGEGDYMIIKRIDVSSAGKISGIIFAAIGLIVGILFFLMSLLGGLIGSGSGDGGFMAMGIIGGFAALIIFPILYGVLGFISGIIQAFVYNLAAGFVGGIKIETE